MSASASSLAAELAWPGSLSDAETRARALHKADADRSEPTTESILGQLKASPPLSVTMAEKIADLREWAADRCVPAD